MKNINSYSHVYILGHHYLEDNEYQISDNQKGNNRVNYSMNNVAKLFLDCTKQSDVSISRSNPHLTENSIYNQKLKISLVLCDSATGYLDYDDSDQIERNYLDSLASNFINELFNSKSYHYLDCIVTGIIGYVYPVLENESSTPSMHKLYRGRLLTSDGEVFMTPLGEVVHHLKEAARGSDQWKLTFTAASNTTEADIRNSKVKVVYNDAATWKNAKNVRIENKTTKIQRDLTLFKEYAEKNQFSDTKEMESKIEKGIINYDESIHLPKNKS